MTADQQNILLGAVIGFFSSILATYFLDLIHQERRSRVISKAIREEINALIARYNNSIGKELEDLQGASDNQLLGEFYASRDYFSIYDSIAHELPIINNQDVIKLTTQLYIETKGHLDTWSQYNSVFVRWQENIRQANTSENNEKSHMYFHGTDRNLKEVLNLYINDVLIAEYRNIKNIHNNLNAELDNYLKTNFIFAAFKRICT